MNELDSNFRASPDDLHRYNFALAALRELGEYAAKTLRSGKVHVEIKPDGTPVTNIDRDIEEKFTELVEEEYGHEDVVLGEELSNADKVVPEDKRIWKLDPLDGTGWVQRLIESGSADYGELRALILAAHFRQKEKIPVFGLCHSPFFQGRAATLSAIDNRTYYQNEDQAPTRLRTASFEAQRNIRLVRCYEKNGLAAATQDVSEEELKKLMPMAQRVKAPLFMGNIALQKVELSIFPGPSQPHDVAAGALAVINAGGVVKDFDGNDFVDIDWRRYPINGVIGGVTEELVDQVIAHYKNL
jgi:3'-phosphoadenosine 5'-phosphosulfate (PAPS) 3'-phosphatase